MYCRCMSRTFGNYNDPPAFYAALCGCRAVYPHKLAKFIWVRILVLVCSV